MSAFLFIAHKRNIRRRIEDMRIMHLAAKGKPKDVKDQADKWQRES